MRILTFTSLYPNNKQPRHGVFVRERLRHLRLAYPDIEQIIVAPVPWFPLRHPAFGNYAIMASVPGAETQDGIEVLHPRYAVIPKVGMSLAPTLMMLSLLPYLRRLRDSYPFDVIDAHFLYPDGVAAVALGRVLGVPVMVTARGNDLSLYPQWLIPRLQLRWCLRHASAIVTVCKALADTAIELLPEATGKIHVLRNGVDLQRFRPTDRNRARAELGLDSFTLLSVGHLIERKGHHLVIEALRELPDVKLIIAGDGPWQDRLEALASRLDVSDRVRFLGHVDQDSLPVVYTAADALVLASSREGWANVLLESMACGTPVAATAVWGTPEVVRDSASGVLIKERSPGGIRDGIRELQGNYPERADTRRYAEQYSWEETSSKQWQLFKSIIE